MTTGKRSVVVKQLPCSSDLRHQRLFLEEVEACLDLRRPCLVLDCSALRELDEKAIHLMLHCLELALKRNGDVKLAAIPPSAAPALAASRLERLFDIHASTASAVASFHPTRFMGVSPAAAIAPLQTVKAA